MNPRNARLDAKMGAEANRIIPADPANQVAEGNDRTQDDAMEAAFEAGTLPEQDRRAPEKTPDTFHALDAAPVNSKIVVVYEEGKTRVALLSTPLGGLQRLPADDPAQKLPIGAKIVKVAEMSFRSEQMSPAYDHAPLLTQTAGEAITNFVPHFHSD